MQHQTQQIASPKKRKPGRKVMFQDVGRRGTDGALIYPERDTKGVAVALCQKPTEAGLEGVYELVVEAIRARPEFANMRYHSKSSTTQRVDCYKSLIDQDSETYEKVRSDALPSAVHRDCEQMSTELIYCRFMWKLRSLLERNIRTRQKMAPLMGRDQQLSKWLPVPMQAFCESEQTWWKLMRRILTWMSVAFAPHHRLSMESQNQHARAVRTAVHEYRLQHGITGDSQYGDQADETGEDHDVRVVVSGPESTAPRTPSPIPTQEGDVVQCSPS